MKIAFVAEKSSLATMAFASYARVHPDHNIDFGAYAFSISHLNRRFNYPRGLSWSDYPFSENVRYRPFDFQALTPAGPVVAVNGELRTRGDSTLTTNQVRDRLLEADRIIMIGDTHPSDELTRLHVARELFPDGNWCDRLRSATPSDLRTETLDALMADPAPYKRDEHKIAYAEAKKRFDYNFNVNSMAVLGKALKLAGAAETPPLSKVGLQLLYVIRDQPDKNHSEITRIMQDWKGSGRYLTNAGEGRRNQFGSAISRAEIIDNLQKSGLVTTGARLMITPAGERLLNILHPDSEDPDLFFRMDEWCRLPVENSFPKIDSYIRTFFGKSIRRL